MKMNLENKNDEKSSNTEQKDSEEYAEILLGSTGVEKESIQLTKPQNATALTDASIVEKIESFSEASARKKIIFFLVALFSGIWGLIFLNINVPILTVFLLLIFVYVGMFWSLFVGKKIFLFLLPVSLFVSGILFDISPFQAFGFSLFCFGSGVLFFSFLQSYHEKLKLSFFRDGFRSIKSGMIFLILGLFFLFFGNFSVDNLSQKILTSDEYSSFVESITQNEDLNAMSEEILVQKISLACRGNTACIAEATKKAKLELENTLEDEIEGTLNPIIIKYTNPELLRTLAQEKKIPYFSEFSGEVLIKILLGVILFFVFIPFVSFISLVMAMVLSFVMFFLMIMDWVRFGKKNVKKEIVY